MKYIKAIVIAAYMFVVLYLANLMVDLGILYKNFIYLIIVLPVLLGGVIFINLVFDKNNKRK